jgi:hypothetical protein
MIGNNQVCGVCHSEAGHNACLCDGVIIILCIKCSRGHLIDRTKDHNLVDIDLALRMRGDSSLVKSFLFEHVRVDQPLKSLKDLSNKAERVKKNYIVCKDRLIAHIEDIFNQLIRETDDILKDYGEKIDILKTYKTSLCDEGRYLIEKYKGSGIRAIVENIIESAEIPLEEIIEYLTKSAFRQMPPSMDSSSLSEKDRVIDTLRSEIEDKEKKYHSLNDAYNSQILRNAECKIQISHIQARVEKIESEVLASNKQIKYLNYKLENQLNDLKFKLQNSAIYINQKNYENSSLIYGQEPQNSQLEKLSEGLSESEEEIQELDLSTQGLEQDLDNQASIVSEIRRYIYTPLTSRKSLMQYDILFNKVKVIDITTMSRDFSTTSSCELPDGDVFLAGFLDLSFEAYIFKIATQKIITLPRLFFPRCMITLFYYRDYVYAFGGKNHNKPERYSLLNNSWETLPRMKYKRESLSCIGIDDKIYLFCGGYINIEIFDTITLQFTEINIDNSDTYSSESAVACRVEDKVYLLTDSLIQVYDTALNKLTQYSNTYKYQHFTINNIIYYSNSIYYYNYHTLTIEKIDISLPILEPKIYSHNPNRYIYRTRDQSKEIYSIDLEDSTIQTFNLSTPLNRNFIGTSLCVINTGEVILAGFKNPVSAKCYLFSPKSNSCHRIGDLKTPRYFITLIYHDQSIYAFGGRGSGKIMTNKAEKIDVISKNSWSTLSEMIKRRSVPSCIGVNDKIYIMGGSDSSIEIYNINTNSYQLSHISLESNYVVSVMVDDQIHIIGDKRDMILSDNLEIISNLQDKYEQDDFNFTLGNIVCYEGKIYFYNQGRKILERVNPLVFKREVQLIAHSIKVIYSS